MCCMLSRVQLFVTPWTVAHQAPLSLGFSGKNTRVGCHFFLQGIFPTQGLELSPSLAGRFFTIVPPEKSPTNGVQPLKNCQSLYCTFVVYVILFIILQ